MNGIDKIRQCCNNLPFSVVLLNKITVDIAKNVFEKILLSDDVFSKNGMDGITSAKLGKFLPYYDFARVLPDDEHDRMSAWTKGVTFLNKVFGDEDITIDEKNCYTVLRSAIADRYEKYDGSGHPQGKRKGDICVLAQILAMSEIAAEQIIGCASADSIIHILEQHASSHIDPRIIKYGVEVVSELLLRDRQYFAACDSDEYLQMDYQPVVDVSGEESTFCGYENRLILKDTEFEILTPEVYVPVAERSGRIVALTDMHLEKLCRRIALRRYDPDFRILPVWVEVSPVCLKRKSFALNLRRFLTKYRIHPDYIVILVTETALGYEDAQIPLTIAAIRQLGVKVVLDHFGSEYSSLAELDKIEIDMIRLDPMFADTVQKNSKAAEIVRSITELAVKLGVEVAVSGIRDEAAREILADLPVRYMQSDIFGIWGAL